MPINPAILGLTRAVPGSALMDPDDTALDPRMAPIGDVMRANLGFQQRLKGELEDRLSAAQRTAYPSGPGTLDPSGLRNRQNLDEITALLGGVGRAQTDIAENPITQQRPDVDAINRANQAAIMSGFTGAGGSASEPAQQAAVAARAAEAAKTTMPLQVEQARQKGFEQRFQELQSILNQPGGLPAGTQVAVPGGGSIRTAAPSQMLPGGAGGKIQDEIDKLSRQRARLDTPDPLTQAQDYLARIPGTGNVGLYTIEQRKAALDKQIADLKQQMRGPVTQARPSMAPSTTGEKNPRDQAIAFLQSQNYPVTEAAIQYVLSQAR